MKRLNQKQIEFLNKEFIVDGLTNYTLTRGEFEGFPDPMMACTFTDEQMVVLANRVAVDIANYGIDENTDNEDEQDELELFWYKSIEDNAVDMGMKYYEDYSEEEINELTKEFDNIK